MSMPAPDQRVTIVDLRIPFWRLMMFFIKASFAAIPAAIIVSLVIMIVSAVIAGLIGGTSEFMMRRWTF